MKKLIIPFLLALLIIPSRAMAAREDSTVVSGNEALIRFPESITFQANLSNDVPIASVTLEYGVNQLTCGTVVAKAFPQFEPANKVDVSWLWDMRQSGSLPPGETVWWQWRIMDVNGLETLTEKKTVTWLDAKHKWKAISEGDLHLHWYSGNEAFAQTLLDSASDGLALLNKDTGLTLDAPVDFYIYANTTDMKDAVLYEPSWTGGQAYAINDIVILGVSEQELDWGKDSIVHELTHVLVGHLTFSCLGDVPTWLSEGLAVYSEGELDPFSQQQLDTAIKDNTLLTLRSLSGGFSEIRDKATLSYSQSYSVTKYLIEAHGQEKMNSLLLALRDGSTVDAALQTTYGFNVEGLESEWRAAIGAQPMTVAAQPTAMPSPTYVPTIVPVGGSAVSVTPTPFVIPTSSFSTPSSPLPPSTSAAPTAMMAILLACCCATFIIIIGAAIVWIVKSQKKKGGQQ